MVEFMETQEALERQRDAHVGLDASPFVLASVNDLIGWRLDFRNGWGRQAFIKLVSSLAASENGFGHLDIRSALLPILERWGASLTSEEVFDNAVDNDVGSAISVRDSAEFELPV